MYEIQKQIGYKVNIWRKQTLSVAPFVGIKPVIKLEKILFLKIFLSFVPNVKESV